MTDPSMLGGRGDPRPPSVLPIVEAIGVSKRYGATLALSDARIRVMPGESHALVGRNGAGKSTLVGILTGLREPDSGEVRFPAGRRRRFPTGKRGVDRSPASISIRPSFPTSRSARTF